MKNISRTLCLVLSLVMLLAAFAACNGGSLPSQNVGNEDNGAQASSEAQTVQLVYTEAQRLGYTGSLEDFLALCKGADGKGISGIQIDENGYLIVYYTDAPTTPIVLGNVIGPKGEQGEPGITPQLRINADNEWEVSADGGTTWRSTGVKATGLPGDKGADGASIAKVEFDEQGRLVITLTDGRVLEPIAIPDKEEHTHAYGDWIMIAYGSCGVNGTKLRICECGAMETESTPVVHKGEWKTLQQPTWEKEGLKVEYCSECGIELDRAAIPVKTLGTQVPEELDYKGEEITLMYWSEVERPEFEQKEITGDNVRDAIYDRNTYVEEQLNIEISFVGVPAAYYGAREPFLRQIDAIYAANTQDYDIIATYARTEGTLAVQGYLQNLNKIEESYIDYDSPWWPQRIVESLTIGNGHYFLSGDISTNTIWMMHCMFINEDMFSQLEMDLPYQIVRDGKWTVDKLMEITSDQYRDMDKDNRPSENDRYGFVALNYVCDSLYVASNLRYIEQNDVETLVLSPDFSSKKAVGLINKLGAWAGYDSIWITRSGYNTDEENSATRKIFAKGGTLVWMEHFCLGESSLLNVDFDYGLLPLPKYDEKQINYYTGVGNPCTMYGIFVDFDDRGDRAETLRMFSAVLETYAAASYYMITPEIYEVNMQFKYDDRSAVEAEMFDYLRCGIVFDLGKICAAELNTVCEMPSMAIHAGAQWQYMYPALRRSVETSLRSIVENFRIYQAIRDQ